MERKSIQKLRKKSKDVKIFRRINRHLAVIGLTPNQRQNQRLRLNFRQITFVVVCIVNVTFLSSYVFLVAHGIEEYMDAIFSLIVIVTIATAYISFIFNNDKCFNITKLLEQELVGIHKLEILFSKLKQINNYSGSKRNPISRAIHKKTNRRIENLSKLFYFVTVKLCVPGLMLPKAIICYFIFFTTDAGNDAFQLPFETWFPFNWHNPIGYFFALICQAIVTFPVFIFLGCIPPLACGAFLFAMSFAEDWLGDLCTINEMANSVQTKADIIEHVTGFVRSHSDLNELFNGFLEILESNDTIDPVLLWKSIILFFIVFGMVYFPCEAGQQLTDTFDEVYDEFNKLDWYLFPFEVQRTLPTILVGLQKPFVLVCFGTVSGSRDQFKKVANTVYKYFNVLRNLFN